MASLLRKTNHTHPFAPFLVDDVAAAARLLEGGFDPFWRDEHDMTCIMVAATKGHGETLNLALKFANDPASLAAQKTSLGLDAFDMAAASGSVSCMASLSKRLPADYRSAIGQSLLWHAVESYRTSPASANFADAWIADLCVKPNAGDLQEAIAHAVEVGFQAGAKRLRSALMRSRTAG